MPVLTQPPDPSPRVPELKLPAGACDTHIHLFGPADRYAFDPKSPYISGDALAETYMTLQDRVGLSRAVIVSGGGYGPNARHLADVLNRYPGSRFRGVALLPEQVTGDELSELHSLGVRGLRFVSSARGAHLPHLAPAVARRAADYGWHVQFYPSGTDIIEHADQLLALPNPIVLDHFAAVPAEGGVQQAAFKTVLRMLDTGRVWVKLSGPMRCTRHEYPYAPVTPMAQALVRHAPERLVWGSDWPHVNMNDRQMPNDGDLVDLIGDWIPDERTRQQILVDNPCALYDFPPPHKS